MPGGERVKQIGIGIIRIETYQTGWYFNLLSMLICCELCRKKPFSTWLRHYSELIDALMKQTVQLHSQAMATSILMDADSNDWANNKDFYEVSLSYNTRVLVFSDEKEQNKDQFGCFY
jgi:hypothetical protein